MYNNHYAPVGSEQRPLITKLLMVETGTYNDMAYRPFQTQVDLPTLQTLQEATMGGSKITPENISGIAGGLLRPTAQAQGVVNIPNGFAEPRFRFLMELEFTGINGTSTRQVFTGYSDYLGISHGGHIDPNMRLFFNTAISMRVVPDYSASGLIHRATVNDASHILLGEYNPSMHRGFNNMGHYTMRPEDLFCSMQANFLGNAEQEPVMDMRTSFGVGAIKKSRRSNGSAPVFLSKTMNAMKSAMDATDGAGDFPEILDRAAGQVREQLISNDPFLKTLQQQTQLMEGGSITYGELMAISPDLDGRAVVILAKGVAAQQNHMVGQTEHWMGSSMETVTATTLSHSVPSIMMDLMLTKITFSATNRTLDGQFHIQIMQCEGFSQNVDLSPYLDMFVNRLQVEILRDLTLNNAIDIALTMAVDVIGETRIDIGMNGNPTIPYATPSFCDSLTAPVIASSQQHLNSLSMDIENMREALGVHHQSAGAQYATGSAL